MCMFPPGRKFVGTSQLLYSLRCSCFYVCIIIFYYIICAKGSCGSFNNREPGHSHASIMVMCVCVLCMYTCRVLRLLQVYNMPRIWNVWAKSQQTLESCDYLRTWQIDLFISTGYRPQMSGRIIVLSSHPSNISINQAGTLLQCYTLYTNTLSYDCSAVNV